MTRQSTFKKKIRERMKKTNERYAAARLALLQQSPTSSAPTSLTAPDGYAAVPGVHGDTARLTAALNAQGVPAWGDAWDEATVFALTGGIGFMYFLFQYEDSPPLLTFVCRSFSLPGPVIERAIENAELDAVVTQTTSANKASKELDAALDAGDVVHLTVDNATLPWSGTEALWAGQMPKQINVLSKTGETYLIDDGRLREIDADLLARARGAVRKAKHRMVVFRKQEPTPPIKAAKNVCESTARGMTEAPFKGFTNNFGLKGLQKAASLVGGTKDKKSWSRVFDSPALSHRALVRTWECVHLDYTPPAAGRAFYATGLRNLAGLCDAAALATKLNAAAKLADESGAIWERLADRVLEEGGSAVRNAIEISEEMEALTRDDDAGGRIRELRTEKDALAKSYRIDDAKRDALYHSLGEDFAAIHEVEARLVETLRKTSK